MDNFHFELVSPDKLVYRGETQSVLVPGGEGDFLVLKNHAPVMASIRPGIVEFADASGKATRIFVRGGFAEVNQAGLILLAETAMPVEELGAERIAQEIANAEEDLADANDDGKRLAQEKLDRLKELKDALKI
jgi:F-type H+-transporting ATPase subunit epsilon